MKDFDAVGICRDLEAYLDYLEEEENEDEQ